MGNIIDILIELTKKEIKIRYKNSYLGYLWSLANPLLTALIFYFVFKTVSRMNMDNYVLFLISGLFIWQFIINSFTLGTMVFIGNSGLIKKVKFQRHLLAIALILSEGFNFILSIPIIVGFAFYYGKMPDFLLWIIGIPLLFIITSLFIYGSILFLGSINLFFRDLERIINLLMMFVFYLTPILYPLYMIPKKYLMYIKFNPFTSFIVMWRELFLQNTLNYHSMIIAFAYSIVFFLIGVFVYNRLKNKFAELV